MKTLELNQMEETRAGSAWACVAGVGGTALVIIGLTGSGPLGWAAMAMGGARAFFAGGSLGACAHYLSNR